jgi:quinohemoprotein ethanol dehydrogenase
MAFALNGTAQLPPRHNKIEAFPKPVAQEPEPALAVRGREIWDAAGCEICHGVEAIGGLSSVPDLRRIGTVRYDLFSQIVRGGLFKDAGMPVFAETLREEDLPALKAYIMNEAWKAYRADQSALSGN